MMRCAGIRSHGGTECIEVMELDEPVAVAGDVAISVRAAALNHLDIWVRRGGRATVAMPHVLGSDCAGVVAAVGQGVRGISPGQEVVVNPGLSCGRCRFCLGGQQSLCAEFGLLGMARWGTYAQRLVVSAANVHPKPPHLTFEEAAALGLAHVTAWRMLMTRAGLAAGQSVLIHGIGGGVALAGLQIAKFAGAEVIVTSSSDDKLARAQSLGADHAVNYKRTPDVALAARDLTGGAGVDVAMDTVGAATLPASLSAVRRGGTIVNCGVTTGAEAKVNLQQLYWNQVSLLGSTMGSHEDFRRMLAAVTLGKIKPIIDSVFPLDDVREATRLMEEGKQFGKIVIRIS